MNPMDKQTLPAYTVATGSKPVANSSRIYPESKEFIDSIQRMHAFPSQALALDYIISHLCNQEAELTLAKAEIEKLKAIEHTPAEKETIPGKEQLLSLMADTEKVIAFDGFTPALNLEILITWISDYCHTGTSTGIKKILTDAGIQVTPAIEAEIENLQFPLPASVQNTFPELFNTAS
jgi:hypothetical protein